MSKHVTKGFTLIELLVVIAIIGILSSVVLASLNDARQKSRDAKRVADIKQLQLALQLRFDSVGNYPTQATLANISSALSGLAPTYIATLPSDPLNTGVHIYQYAGTATDFVLRTVLENSSHPALSSGVRGASVAPGNVNCNAANFCVKP